MVTIGISDRELSALEMSLSGTNSCLHFHMVMIHFKYNQCWHFWIVYMAILMWLYRRQLVNCSNVLVYNAVGTTEWTVHSVFVQEFTDVLETSIVTVRKTFLASNVAQPTVVYTVLGGNIILKEEPLMLNEMWWWDNNGRMERTKILPRNWWMSR